MARNIFMNFISRLLSESIETRQGTVLAVLATVFFSTCGVGAYTFSLSLSADSIGMSASWLGLAFSGYFLARLVLAPLAGCSADYFGPIPLLRWACGIGTVVPCLYLFFPVVESLGIIQICLGFCAGIVKPVSMSLLGQCAAQKKRGRLFALYNTCLYCAFVIGPIVGGAGIGIQGKMGSLTLIWPALGLGVSFVALLISKADNALTSSEKQKEKEGLPWRNAGFLSLLLAVLGRTAGASVVITFLPRLISEYFGLSGFFAGFLFAIPNLIIILAMPVTGRWADARDRFGLTFLGMGFCAACLFGLGQSVPLWLFCLLVAGMGLGSALSLPASMSLAADMGGAKGQVMGFFLGVSNLGFVLGPGIAGFAAEAGGMADAFELTALFGGLCLLPTLIFMSKRLYAE